MAFKDKLMKWGANIVAPGSGFLVGMAQKLKKGGAKTALGVGAAGAAAGAAVASAAKSKPAPVYAPAPASISPASAKNFAQAGVIFLAGLLGWWLLGRLGFGNVAVWSVVFGFVIAVARIWPVQGFIAMFGLITYIALSVMGLLTSTALILTVSLTLLGIGYTKAPEKFGQLVMLVLAVFGGLGIFLLSAWFQNEIGVTTWPHIFTTVLLLAYLAGIGVYGGKKRFLIYGLLNVLFFTVLLSGVLVNSPLGYRSGSFIDSAVDSQRSAWISQWQGLKGAGETLVQSVRESILVATGDYESGVEAQSEKPLGVFLENIGISSSEVMTDGIVNAYATLRAESFRTDNPLIIKVKCYMKGHEDDENYQGEVRPRSEFSVFEYESQSLDCIFDDLTATGPGPFDVVFDAEFTFTTSAFLKSYFMDQERKRALDKELAPQGKTALDFFQIVDKNPSAVYTGGPLKIGIGVGQQPVALAPPEAGQSFGPTLRITFDKNWAQGDLYEIAGINVILPPGLSIVKDNAVPVSCVGGGQNELSCQLSDVGKLFPEQVSSPRRMVAMPKTISIFTTVDEQGIDTLLGDSALAIRSFKVGVDYTFRIKREIGVSIKERKQPEVS